MAKNMNANPEIGVFLPGHKICEKNVEVPTISLLDIGPPGKEKPTLCVQWFGETEKPLVPRVLPIPEGSQFLFPLMAKPNDVCFFGEPEKFYVVFLDQVKFWLEPMAVQSMMNGPGGGDPDTWIIWLMNSQVGMDFGGYPASPAVKIVLLGDPNCGVIYPRSYRNLEARDEAIKAHAAQFQEN